MFSRMRKSCRHRKSFCSSSNDDLKCFGHDYGYTSKVMTQKENTVSEKQGPSLVLENDSPGIPVKFASSL